jgi:hypothetical protein
MKVMKTLNETKNEMKTFEKLVNAIAGLRIMHKKTNLSFEAETARIERIVEHFYTIQDFDEDFYEYGIAFIKDVGKDIVLTTDYDGMFVDDMAEA